MESCARKMEIHGHQFFSYCGNKCIPETSNCIETAGASREQSNCDLYEFTKIIQKVERKRCATPAASPFLDVAGPIACARLVKSQGYNYFSQCKSGKCYPESGDCEAASDLRDASGCDFYEVDDGSRRLASPQIVEVISNPENLDGSDKALDFSPKSLRGAVQEANHAKMPPGCCIVQFIFLALTFVAFDRLD